MAFKISSPTKGILIALVFLTLSVVVYNQRDTIRDDYVLLRLSWSGPRTRSVSGPRTISPDGFGVPIWSQPHLSTRSLPIETYLDLVIELQDGELRIQDTPDGKNQHALLNTKRGDVVLSAWGITGGRERPLEVRVGQTNQLIIDGMVDFGPFPASPSTPGGNTIPVADSDSLVLVSSPRSPPKIVDSVRVVASEPVEVAAVYWILDLSPTFK